MKIYDVEKLRIKFSELTSNKNVNIFLNTKIDFLNKDNLETSKKKKFIILILFLTLLTQKLINSKISQ